MYNVEPTNYSEATISQDWFNAMKIELEAIEKNNIRAPIELPSNKKAIGVKWVFKTKLNPDGFVLKYKVRLVVRFFTSARC